MSERMPVREGRATKSPRAALGVLPAAAGAAILFAACVAFVLSTRKIAFNSDQAIVGLMARHILAGKGHPVFFYGATYDGSVEPHFVAGIFALLGPSVASYRFAMLLLLALIVLGAVLVAAEAFGRRAILPALAYLAIPPFFLLYKGLTSDGAYDTIALTGIAAILITLKIARSVDAGRSRMLLIFLSAALGIVVGAGWWVSPVTLSVSAICAVWLVWTLAPGRRAVWLASFCSGTAIGSLPWWIWNFRHGFASLHAAETVSAGPTRFARNLVELLWTGLPALEGGVVVTPNPAFIRQPFFGARAVTLLLVAVLLGASLVDTVRRRDRVRGLLWSCMAILFVAAAWSGRTIASEPRFLIAYFAVLPALAASEIVRRDEAAVSRRWAVVALAGLVAVHAAGILAGRPNRRVTDLEVTGSLEPLIRSLEERGIHAVYANYWTAYRLSFESGERVIGTPFTGDDLVRYEPHRRLVDADPRAAVVLVEPRDSCFRHFLLQRKMPFTRTASGNFGIYSGLEPGALASLHEARGLPLPDAAYRVRWDVGGVPVPPPKETMPASSSRDDRVTLTNEGECPWPSSVHLSYHWWSADSPDASVYDGERAYLPAPVYPGATATVPIRLKSPSRPGHYRLEYDLVQENVDWFSTRGGQTYTRYFEITPSSALPGR